MLFCALVLILAKKKQMGIQRGRLVNRQSEKSPKKQKKNIFTARKSREKRGEQKDKKKEYTYSREKQEY